MENFAIVLFMLTILVGLSALIEKIRLPHPVFFVVAGLAIGFIPFLPNLALDPEVIFVIFLPPLLYDAAFRTSWHDFKTDIRPITALAVSLVFFTTIVVAITAYFLIPGFTWPLAFLLGAIISPPDAVATTGIIRGLGLNKRIVTILEGESLVNDASALIAYRYALAAVATGNFILWQAGLQFLLVVGGGIAIGIAVGYILVAAHKKIDPNPAVESSLTLLTPFLSYLAAEQLHTSGILAVVSTGLFISWHSHEIFSYQVRMRSKAVWATLMFLLNGFVFILIGMQLPYILRQLPDYTLPRLILYGTIISLVTIFIRIVWVFAGAYFAKLSNRKNRNRQTDDLISDDENTWKNVLIISWTGTRGVISLAAALAIPLTLYNGSAFPHRPMILFLCFVVIFITLVVQGLSLRPLVRLLGVKKQNTEEMDVRELQLYIVNSTLDYIDEAYSGRKEDILRTELKKKYEKQASQLSEKIKDTPVEVVAGETPPAPPLTPMQKARIEIVKFQRELLLRLHKEKMFSNSAIKEVEKTMDIDELRLDEQVP